MAFTASLRSAITRKRLRWTAQAWITCLVILSLQPRRFNATHQGAGLHWVAHVFAFGVAAVLLFVLARSRGQQWIGALSLVGLATAIETAQCLIYHGVFEWWDVRSDTAGILIAMVCIRLSMKTRDRRPLL